MRVMKNFGLGFIIGLLVIITSCGGDATKTDEDSTSNNKLENKLNFAITEKYQTLDPISISDVTSFHIASQIFECLLRFDDTDLSLQPMIAKSWVVSEDGLTYTFHLKKGVHFQDNDCFDSGKGRELKAADVVYTFKRICSNESDNYAYQLFKDKIVGAVEFHDSELGLNEKELEGVKAIDDYNVEIKLNKVSSIFLESVATIFGGIVAKEAIEKNAIVGTGPFVYSKASDSDTEIVLAKNNNYHIKDAEGNALPYLDAVSFNYIPQGQEQLDAFMAGDIDVVTNIPPNAIKELVEDQIADFQDRPVKYFLGRNAETSISFLDLNTTIEPLNNKKVRQAIAHAINKSRIVEDILKGEAYGPADHGLVPPSVRNYDFTSVVGLEYNVQKAKKLLAEAGYKDGKGFPTLIFTTNKNNTSLKVALNIQKQLLTNLNINVEISAVTLAESMETKKYAKGGISLEGWLAEYPDALSFLILAYGENVPKSLEEPSYPNGSRYVNPEFDKIYKNASETLDEKQKHELCLVADQMVTSDAPMIPLWYHEKYGLIQSSVKNYNPNAMNIWYLTRVKIGAPTPNKKKGH
jgi:peptide/nickel transport system substrate-binding protein